MDSYDDGYYTVYEFTAGPWKGDTRVFPTGERYVIVAMDDGSWVKGFPANETFVPKKGIYKLDPETRTAVWGGEL